MITGVTKTATFLDKLHSAVLAMMAIGFENLLTATLSHAHCNPGGEGGGSCDRAVSADPQTGSSCSRIVARANLSNSRDYGKVVQGLIAPQPLATMPLRRQETGNGAYDKYNIQSYQPPKRLRLPWSQTRRAQVDLYEVGFP